VLDADTGASRLSVPLGQAGSVHVASDESAAWVISGAASGALLRKIALPSGDERLSIPLPVAITFPGYSFSHVGVDVSRQRVFVSFEQVGSRYSLGGDIRSFDTETGAEAPRVSLEGWSDAWLDHGAGHVLAFSQSYLYTTGCGEGTLHTVSAATGQELSRVGLGTRVCLTQIGFGTPPRPPTLNAPVVSPARTVTLSWARAPELTLGFTVEAGSAPGLANIATFPVTNLTTLTVPNVPPGTYYVRVRAWNYIGPSVPSNEIVVTVP
jgi:hypothetical protein